jgi:thiamine-phosphate pyrophosphorylase
MKLIVISPSENIPNELEIISSLFENGLEIFHVYKPNFSGKEIENYIKGFPIKYQNRIFLHPQFPKFHSLEELENYKEKYDYAFLSPIFDSISKIGYISNFNLIETKETIKGKNIIALGGIDEDKIEIVRELGFRGIAVCGAVWQSQNPLEKFLRIKEKCQKKDLVF